MKQQLSTNIIAVAIIGAAVSLPAQGPPAVVTTAAPIYLLPDSSRVPLRTAAVDTTLRVIEDHGAWLKIEFKDPQFGLRVGYVESKHVRVAQAQPSDQTPTDLSVEQPPNVPPPTELADSRESTGGRAPESRGATASTSHESRQFTDAQLTIPDGDKSKQMDVAVSFAADAFQLLDKKTRRPLKEFAYKSFVGGEYSHSKSPRWKSGLFISPFLFLSSGKKHWLLVKTAEDYAMLRLDKSNYKLIIAEWEIRTGLKVEALGENK